MTILLDDDRLPLPDIFNFEGLFRFASLQRSASKHRPLGLKQGSTVLITGRPGSGKTLFGLSIAREHLLEFKRLNPSLKPNQVRLLYIGVAVSLKSLQEQFGFYNWFGDSDNKLYTLTVISVEEQDLPIPTRGAEDVINPALLKIRKFAEQLGDDDHVFVIFDSVTALIKGSRSSGDRRRNLEELVGLTRKYLDSTVGASASVRKKLCVLIGDSQDMPDDATRAEKEAVANFVFHLGFREAGSGRIARVLDVRKCPEHTPMLLGKHSWEMLHPYNAARGEVAIAELANIVRLGFQKRDVHKQRFRSGLKAIAIFPRLPMPDIGFLQDERWQASNHATTVFSKHRLSCGIPGLDEMLLGNARYWAKPIASILAEAIPERADQSWGERGGLILGSTTFVIGKAGTGKSNLCLEFLLAEPINLKQCAYVNFENRPHRILDWYPGSQRNKRMLQECHTLYRRRSNFDPNVFLGELVWLVKEHDIRRLAIDGISDLTASMSHQEFELFIEELVVQVREAKRIVSDAKNSAGTATGSGTKDRLLTIFLTLESDPDALTAYLYDQKDSPADNVILLRHIKINDERRKVVEVRKARGLSPDRKARELIVLANDDRPLRVIPGLDNYSCLLSGQPQPLKVALQLICENRSEQVWNKRIVDRLDQLFGYELKMFGFSREEINRTLLDIANGTDRIPFSDVKILNVDEWWVRELRVKARRKNQLLASTPHPLLRLNDFLVCDPGAAQASVDAPTLIRSDFWAVEMEKVCVPVVDVHAASVNEGSHRVLSAASSADVVALPSFADYGFFCVSPGRFQKDSPIRNADKFDQFVDAVPRRWATATDVQLENRQLWWFESPKLDGKTLIDVMAAAMKPYAWQGRPDETIGFAFDMETPVSMACFFLELSWAFGGSEDLFIRDVLRFSGHGDRDLFLSQHPATRALGMLMFMVLEGLMPPRTTLLDTRRALFSRHWFSSVAYVDDNAVNLNDELIQTPCNSSDFKSDVRPFATETPQERQKRVKGMTVVPVPFFPMGAFNSNSGQEVEGATGCCLQDGIIRFRRTVSRINAAIHYRSSGQSSTTPHELEPLDLVLHKLATCLEGGRVLDIDQVFRKWENWRPGLENPPGWQNPLSQAKVLDILELLLALGNDVREYVLASPHFPVGLGFEHDSSARNDRFDSKYVKRKQASEATECESNSDWSHLPYAMFMDLRDALELLRWHEFRIQSVIYSIKKYGLGALIQDWTTQHDHSSDKDIALSGYSCEGSWLIGANQSTLSPNLSVKFLEEIASLHSSAEQAHLNAGIPTRKDFYELYGDKNVPCFKFEGMTWNKLLTFVGSRTRRRSRAFCARVRVSAAFEELDRLMFHAMTIAGARMDKYRQSNDDERLELISEMNLVAQDAIRRFFAWLTQEMNEKHREDQDAFQLLCENEGVLGNAGFPAEAQKRAVAEGSLGNVQAPSPSKDSPSESAVEFSVAAHCVTCSMSRECNAFFDREKQN